MSSTVHPRDRSFTGFLKPCKIGPMADDRVWAKRGEQMRKQKGNKAITVQTKHSTARYGHTNSSSFPLNGLVGVVARV